MAETYCGKSCESCQYKEQLCCKGCKNGPGYLLTCECELAKCCSKNNYDTCEVCTERTACWKYKSRDYAAQNRLMNRSAEKLRSEHKNRSTFALAKWLTVLCWFLIAFIVLDLAEGLPILPDVPALSVTAVFLRQILCVAYGLVLLKMSQQSDHYRTAGIAMLILSAYNILKYFVPVLSMFSGLLTLPAIGLSIFGLYHEYSGHSETVQPFDRQLSDNWDKLWKWKLGAYAAEGLVIFVTVLFDPYGGLILLGVFSIVFAILEIVADVFLFRSAELFRTQKAVLKLKGNNTSCQVK